MAPVKTIASTLAVTLVAGGIAEFYMHEMNAERQHEPHTESEMPRGPEQIPGPRVALAIMTGTERAYGVIGTIRRGSVVRY